MNRCGLCCFTLLFVRFVRVWHLGHVDHTTARTVIRTWHELHASQNTPHDFSNLLSPEQRDSYIVIINNDEIKALAVCDRNDTGALSVANVAHHPEYLIAVPALLYLLRSNEIELRWEKLRTQPRWFLEGIFLDQTRNSTGDTSS